MVKIGLMIFVFCLLSPLNGAFIDAPWGVDSELIENKKTPPEATTEYSLSNKVCQSMIHFFQNYISPIDGPRSHFVPSSSQYALLAIQKYGVLKGIALGCDRLLRENSAPWVWRTTDKYAQPKKVDLVR